MASRASGAPLLTGLEEFSHVEVVFVHGRGSLRPNRIGVTRCELLGVRPLALTVRGLDAVDGTQVLDVKPLLRELVPAPDQIRQPDWADLLVGAVVSRST